MDDGFIYFECPKCYELALRAQTRKGEPVGDMTCENCGVVIHEAYDVRPADGIQNADDARLELHATIQAVLGWLTVAEIEEAVQFAINEGLDDTVRPA